jgi:hypothetical protein
MAHYRDYTKPVVGQSGCSYSSLRNVWGSGNEGLSNYTVPNLCPTGEGPNYPPRYDTLTHGNKGGACGGYFHLKSAYPYAGCDTCSASYVNRSCTGDITCNLEKYKHRY